MGSLRFGAAPEIYESRRSKLLGQFDPYVHSLCSSQFGVGLLVYRKKIVRLDAERLFGFSFHQRKKKSLKILVINSNPNGRFQQTLVDGLEASEGSQLNKDSDEALVGEGLTLMMNPITNSVEIQSKSDANNVLKKSGRKIWSRVVNMNKTVQRRGKKRVSTRNNQSLERTKDSSNQIKDALSTIRPESNVERCNSILRFIERINDGKTIEFFMWMKDHGKLNKNDTAYNLVLRALARKEHWSMAKSVLREMVSDSGCELTSQVFNALIFVCAKRGLVQWGSKWFHMMLERGVQPNVATIGMLMGLYQRNTHLPQAEYTFNQMRSFNLKCISAYSSMITICTRLGLYSKSEEVISLMEEDEVLPNLENWLVRINAYSQQGKLEEAESVLKSMLASGISPNIIAYNTLITGYGKVSNTIAAKRLFRSLQNVGLEPDETSYRSMVEGFGRSDNYKEALRYYTVMKNVGFKPNSSNFYTMINLQARHSDQNSAIKTLMDMRAVGCQYSSILSSLLQAYEKVGRVHELPLILKASFYENILLDPTSCSILVMAYVKNSLLEEALQVLQEKKWKDSEFEGNLYHLLICSCKEAGQFENAVKIYAQMPKSEMNPNLHITCSMIDIYSSLNKFNDAENLYLMLKASEITFDMIAYSIVVRMYIKAGSLKDACLVLDAMEKQKDIVPDTYLFRDMLRTYQQCGLLEKLASVYYRVLRSGIVWDEAMYNCVINCCGHALPVDELSKLFNKMIQCGYSANTITFNVMLDVYGKAGLLKKAREVFRMARKQGLQDVISYNTIIAAYGNNKDFKSMRSVVKQMQHDGLPVSLEAYNCMLHAYGKEDLLEEFNEVLQKMKEASCPSDHYTYNIMINIYGKKGWIEEVACVLGELKEQGMEPDLYSYNSLIKAYGIAGMVEEAVTVVQQMRVKGIKPDRVTFTNLIAALQRNENFLEAVKWSLWMKQMEMTS
ncbi:uncharacterized protein A4U43_C05F17740 [Asparagus officinalis]|uniref:Pentacotripeptide-repeat region of PRORP domain-containing protein n=1 Tax=Asparagus officinalis TaxID=4686 RepID=A0A5P1EWR9_ASPOF|nr:pentatricopeptide repeat-containing protein At4g30825, chloroplastic [Asparagus officinalis]ONK68951.1 uncharacterized protein A4U43_C05F17740 [Asparagus officinalis]